MPSACSPSRTIRKNHCDLEQVQTETSVNQNQPKYIICEPFEIEPRFGFPENYVFMVVMVIESTGPQRCFLLGNQGKARVIQRHCGKDISTAARLPRGRRLPRCMQLRYTAAVLLLGWPVGVAAGACGWRWVPVGAFECVWVLVALCGCLPVGACGCLCSSMLEFECGSSKDCKDRQPGRRADRQTDGQMDGRTDAQTDTDRQADRQTGMHTDRQVYWQAGRQIGRQTSRNPRRQASSSTARVESLVARAAILFLLSSSSFLVLPLL